MIDYAECERCGEMIAPEDGYGECLCYECALEHCDRCGDFIDLDGWDGLCGNCADREEAES